MNNYYLTQTDYLMHHGVKGQKWGNRQYQYEDGSLTPLGRVHYGYGEALNKGSRITSNIGSGMRSVAKKRTYGRIGSSIANRAATIADRTSRNLASLKKISDSNDSGAKKLLKSLSYMSVPTVHDIIDPRTGEKTGKKGFGRIAGSGWRANNSKALADQYGASEHYRITKTGRYISTVQKKNAESFAKYYQNRADSNSVKEYIHNTFSGLMKTPITRLTGKETTVGKEIVKGALTFGLAGYFSVNGQIGDQAKVWLGRQGVKNYKDSVKHEQIANDVTKFIAKRAAKKKYQKEKQAIQNKYDSRIEALESKYSKGERLSDADLQKQEQYEREAQDAWKRNSERYKNDLKIIKNS